MSGGRRVAVAGKFEGKYGRAVALYQMHGEVAARYGLLVFAGDSVIKQKYLPQINSVILSALYHDNRPLLAA